MLDVVLALLLFLAFVGTGLGQSTVQFSATAYTVAENAGVATFTVQRTDDTNTVVTVDYTSANGTATAGLDYNATNGTLTFAAGETNQTLSVPILNDGLVETIETFMMTLSNPTGGAVLGPYATATIVILDITNTPPHWFDGVAVQPEQSVQLTLGGSVDAHFKDYFDLYPIEVSSNLADWTPLVTLLRTNAVKNALSFTDTQATNLDQVRAHPVGRHPGAG